MRKIFITVLTVLGLCSAAFAEGMLFKSATEFFEFRMPKDWSATENAAEGAISAQFAPAGQTRAAMRITYGESKLADESLDIQKKALYAHMEAMESGAMLKSAMPDMTIADRSAEELRVGSALAVRRIFVASDTQGPVRIFVYEHFIQSGLWFAVSYAYAASDSQAQQSAEAILSSFTFV